MQDRPCGAAGRGVAMPNYADTYEDEDGNVWQFDPPYDDDPPLPDDEEW